MCYKIRKGIEMNSISPINCNSNVRYNYNLSFKAKKTVPRQYAKYVEKSLLLPAAAYTMSFINNLTSKPNNTSQSKQIVVGPPKNLEDMRSRYKGYRNKTLWISL